MVLFWWHLEGRSPQNRSLRGPTDQPAWEQLQDKGQKYWMQNLLHQSLYQNKLLFELEEAKEQDFISVKEPFFLFVNFLY